MMYNFISVCRHAQSRFIIRTSPQLSPFAKFFTASLRCSKRRWMRAQVALFTAVALTLLVTASAGDFHASATAQQDCAICSAVIDKVGDAPNANPRTLAAYVLLYAAAPRLSPRVSYAAPAWFPRICGPPNQA
jgi:hypothetical protein